jgi:sec-independent protein translocase protein TatB
MFDIGFSEVALIFLLALIVLGPEKLPKVAAQVGRWIGRARGMARQFREQLEEEVNLEEARRTQARTTPPAPAVPSSATQHEPPAAPPSASQHEPPSAAQPSTPSHEAAAIQPAAPVQPTEPEQPVYPDTYSHAHPTDSLGRPIPPPGTEPPVADSGQQDWVGSPPGTEKPAQTAANAAYAPSHERGT